MRPCCGHRLRTIGAVAIAAGGLLGSRAGAAQPVLAPVVSVSNVAVRVLTANLTSGNDQRYETAGLNILRGLRPDVAAIQEFNYGGTIRAMVDAAFGTNFQFYRESGTGYTIPNGVVSRWPITASGSWDDPQVPDRGFAWARIDLPGTNDLYVVSVHLHRNGGAGSRNLEATLIKSNVHRFFPPDAWTIIAGDLNTDSRTEACLATLAGIVSDAPVPSDGRPDAQAANTNEPRSRPYDYVLPSFTLTPWLVPVVVGPRIYSNGLVFDSAIFSPLSAVSPVQAGDSHVSGMQHMAVVKDFRIPVLVTNWVSVPAPVLSVVSNRVLSWTGLSNVPYTVAFTTNLNVMNWMVAGTVVSQTTNLTFAVTNGGWGNRFFRVSYP